MGKVHVAIYLPRHYLPCGGGGQDQDYWNGALDGMWQFKCELRGKGEIKLIEVRFGLDLYSKVLLFIILSSIMYALIINNWAYSIL